MNDKVREHIFEPFYTTKEQGTGMGLAVVYGIVKESKGWIEVESKLHCGTTFTIYLPAVDEGFEEEAVRGEEPARGVGSGRRILLVEDEKWVRKSTAMLLAAYGYEVTEARDAERALALFYREKGRYDLVLSDVVLPGRSGLELVNPLLDVNPCISILLCSSHLDAKSQFEQIIKRGLPFIQKPFEIPELIRAIEETIVQAKA